MTCNVIVVLSLTVVLVIVTPLPEILASAPGWNPLPVTVTVCAVVPRARDDGVIVAMDGSATMVAHPVQDALPPSGLTSCTVRDPSVADPDTETLTVSLVVEFRTTDTTVTPSPNDTVPPEVTKSAGKPDPLIVTLVATPRRSLPGFTAVTVGRAFTTSAADLVTEPPSGLSTVTARPPIAAPASIETSSDRCEESTGRGVHGHTGTGEGRGRPGPQACPRHHDDRMTAPCGRELGASDVTVGFGFTVKQAVQTAATLPGLVTVMSWAPRPAEPPTDTATCRLVAETRVVLMTDTPVPDTLVVTPGSNP